MELVLVIRTALLLAVVALLIRVTHYAQKPKGTAPLSLGLALLVGVAVFGVWVASELSVWNTQRTSATALAETKATAAEHASRSGRLLAISFHTAYHATTQEAAAAVKDDEWLSTLARQEGFPSSGAWDDTEPFPLMIRRARRALFELLPLFEYDPALMHEAIRYFEKTDPRTAEAIRQVIRNDARELLVLRRNWTQRILPDLYEYRAEVLPNSDGVPAPFMAALPSSLRIAPGEADPAIPLSITAIPALEEELKKIP